MQSSRVVERGFEFDRRFMIIDEENVFITQRAYPRMALIKTEIDSDWLVLSNDGNTSVRVPLIPQTDSLFPVTIWQHTIPAASVSHEADEWLGSFLGIRCRLVYMPNVSKRPVPSEFVQGDEIVSFADGFPFLLISQESLDDLNGRLPTPLPMNRFRPNIVITGSNAFAEDEWRTIEIGRVRLRSAKLCERCSITTVDERTGIRGDEPLRTLATYRNRGGGVTFGQNLIHETTGIIQVGDALTVLE